MTTVLSIIEIKQKLRKLVSNMINVKRTLEDKEEACPHCQATLIQNMIDFLMETIKEIEGV